MTAAGAGALGGDPEQVAAQITSASTSLPGRISIHDRVLTKVSEQVAATTLCVDPRDVKVDLAEARGGMAVTVSSPLPVPALDDTAAIHAGTPVLERVALIQTELQDAITALIGKNVTRVNIIITGAVIAQKKRVR